MSAPVATMPQANAAAAAAAQAQAIQAANALYMAKALERPVLSASTGGAVTQAWTAGTALNFGIGDVNNGYLKRLRLTFNLTFTGTVGTGTYAKNAAAPYAAINEIDVAYNGLHIRTKPYFEHVKEQMRRYLGFSSPLVPIAGAQINAGVTSQLFAFPSLADGAQTWTWIQDIPLNGLHPLNPSGMLPLSGLANEVQVTVNCAPSLTGVDPLNNCIAITGDTTITAISGTVKVEGIVTDGLVMDGPSRLPLDLSQVPTTQAWWDNPLNNLTAGSMRRQKIGPMLKHNTVCLIVIDGQQSNKFMSSESNLTGFELDADSSGNMPFFRYGSTLGGNIGIDDYYGAIRRTYGQDFDPGVLILVDGNARNIPDASNQNGSQRLDMTATGWPGVNYGVYLGAVGTVVSPRIECFGVGINTLPLQSS